MKIRRFGGRSTAEALRAVKGTLGPDAVILDVAEEPDGVVVTAAADLDEPVLRLPETPAPVRRPVEPPPPDPRPVADRELVREVRDLLGVVHDLVDERWQGRRPRVGAELVPLQRALVTQGVDGVIASALVKATAERLERDRPLETALARALTAHEQASEGRRVQLFIGPPGDGKTTTIVKLAARARRAGRAVTLICTDTYRVGAAGELEGYGRALGARVVRAPEPAALAAAIARSEDAALVLVDTAGVAFGERRPLAELTALVKAAGDGAARTLVASATAGSWAAGRIWRAFAGLRPDACVLTKCDLAPGGPMLGVLWRRGVAVSHVGTGRRIADDLEPATPDRLARCLLTA